MEMKSVSKQQYVHMLVSDSAKMSILHQLEVVGRCSETQLQMGDFFM